LTAIDKDIEAVLNGASDGCIVTGDCLEVMATMPDGCVDLVLTDPPYGHNNKNGDLSSVYNVVRGLGTDKDPRPIANDGPEANELYKTGLPLWRRVLKPGCCCCCCCCGGGGPDPQFSRWAMWMDEEIPFKMCMIWYKGSWGLGHHYRRCWECILIGQVPGAACQWHAGTTVPNVVLDERKPRDDSHPTIKPIGLMAKFIRWHSAVGNVVIDPFCGSGTTCVAAKLLGRRYIGIEISPEYAEIARQRIKAVETGVPVAEAKAGQMGLFKR